MEGKGAEYVVTCKESGPIQDQAERELEERIEKSEEAKQKLEERIGDLKAREKLTASQQSYLGRLQDAYSKAHELLK